MDGGFIMLPRDNIVWSFSDDRDAFFVFMYLLKIASFAKSKWNGIEINRGQCIISLDKLSQNCNLTVKQVRRILSKLERQGLTARKRAKHFSVITICNYDNYQGRSQDKGQDKRQDKRADIYNNIDNIITQKEKVIINDKDVFQDETKKITSNSYSSFIDNIKKICPTISELMELPNIKQYIVLTEKYTDNQLLSIIVSIENFKSWHSYNNLYAAIKQYLANKENLPDYEDEIP